ncbi:MAG: GH1 family beta-glucosidase [Acidimicrobiia bacterium]|nr:GH1 family beta-glucosidase [Acidimicrobiia bacterium]MDH5421496.1 GH1 family beta-glucosidase [Acidimicrobiia bacterium]MDH5502473.1 GH1 family beta-glucosidase [Acidimicrobiia bacterium]
MGNEFTWGVATSAYQIEGGRFEDGKVDSIWDTFSDKGQLPESGDVACDHYHRYPDDIALMSQLGVDAYRMSIAWTRVVDNSGRVNPAGLAFYDGIIDALLAAGISPWITIYHWDLPQSLEDAGGWPDRHTIDAFDHYTNIVSNHFGNRVKNWITINEPWVAAMLGYREGVFAPGRTSMADALAAGHHLLLAHGRAVATIRANVPDARVGIALDCRPSRPASANEADVAANRHFDGFRNRWFFDPVFGLGYPQDMLNAYATAGYLPSTRPDWLKDGDLETIAADIDFLGLNYYTSQTIAAGGEEVETATIQPGPNPPAGYTDMGWAITPDGLRQYLGHLNDTYAPPSIIITENGASFADAPGPDGQVRDLRRQRYLESHIEAIDQAIREGVAVDGYFLWSFLDNLEWTSGYAQRFGIVHVDHTSQTRTRKESFDWYRRRISRPR